MPLTPLDIQNTVFRRALRGFSVEQVNGFMARVGREFELLYKENKDLKERMDMLEGVLANYRQMESTLRDTLVLAQKTADEVRANAHHEAEMICREAENTARERIKQAEARIQEMEQRLEEMRHYAMGFKAKVRAFLLSQLELWEGPGYVEAAATAEQMDLRGDV